MGGGYTQMQPTLPCWGREKMTAHACRNKGRAGGEVIGSFLLAVRKRMSQGAV